MALTTEQIARLDRLLDQSLDLDLGQRRRWLEDLPQAEHDLLPALRDALLQQGGEKLRTLPKFADMDAVADLFHVGQHVGPYELIRRLGEGGMAQVWLARRGDGAYDRHVALKLPVALHLRGDMLRRFARERDILASLEHPQIARLYDAGTGADAMPYLAMEYVPGQTLTDWSDAQHLGLRARLELFLQVLEAVHFAHERGVLHRDIKPSNVMVNDAGQVRLLDFGVAKLLVDDDEHTQLTKIFGRALTPEYTCPEVLRGEAPERASDIYALGVLLCELLTGSRPHRLKPGAALAYLERSIMTVPPRGPSAQVLPGAAAAQQCTVRELSRRLRGDLDSIVLKAVAPQPENRYSGAHAMSDDLRRYLAGQPVGARNARPAYLAARFARRQALPLAAIGSAALLGALASHWWLGERPAGIASTAIAASANDSSSTGDAARGALPPSERSVAVLPFVNVDGDATHEALAEGLSEELIGRLGALPDLRVPARASSFFFKGTSDDVASIAGKLHVANVLEGNVRQDGKRLRVTVSLVRAQDGHQLWSQDYDRNVRDVFQIQDEIARAIAATLGTRMLGGANPFRTASSEAHDHYMRGLLLRDHFDHNSMTQAAGEFRKAIVLDPDYAVAYAGLAIADLVVASNEGDEAKQREALAMADRAVALAPQLSEPRAFRALIHLYQWDWPAAQRDVDAARSLTPVNAWTLIAQAELDYVQGRVAMSVRESGAAVDADPLSSLVWTLFSDCLLWSGDLAAARRATQRGLELAPQSSNTQMRAAVLEVLDGHPDTALEIARGISFAAARLYSVALAESALGHGPAYRSALKDLTANYADSYTYQIAALHAFRGEIDQSFDWLERAFSVHDPTMIYLRVDPLFKKLRTDARYALMLARMKLDPA